MKYTNSDANLSEGTEGYNRNEVVAIPFFINETVDISSLPWTSPTDLTDVWKYNYENEASFGSSTHHKGYIGSTGNIVVIAESGDYQKTTARKISDTTRKFSLGSKNIHRLLDLVDEPQIIEANHSDYPETDIYEMGCGNPNVDEIRKEIRSQRNKVYTAKCNWESVWIKIENDPMHAGLPKTPEAISWYVGLLDKIDLNTNPPS